MKKVLALFLAVLCLATMSVSAFADTLTPENTQGSTTLIFAEGERYEITIPAVLNIQDRMAEIEKDDYATLPVKVNNALIAPGRQLEMRVSSANNFKFKNDIVEADPDLKGGISYTLSGRVNGKLTTVTAENDLILALMWGYTEYSGVLTIKDIDFDSVYTAGEYTDTLTFTASIGEMAQ